LTWLALLPLGCSAVKERSQVVVPPGYERARSASLDEVVRLVNERYASMRSITVPKFDVEFTGGSIDDGYFEKYRKAKGYLVAREPDSIFVNILNPLTNSSVLVMASRGSQFQIWVPSRNQFVTGTTQFEAEERNPVYNVRPDHLVQGILVEPIPQGDSRYRYFLEETQDARFKFYILVLVEFESESPVLKLRRKIWIERSSLTIYKQEYYEEGELVSRIDYRTPIELDDRLVSSSVRIDRPVDSYSISFEFQTDSISLDRPLRPEAFEIQSPAGAEVVVVGEEIVKTD
jgi:hypothetical protein